MLGAMSVDAEPEPPPEVCLINIGPRERRKRAVFGVIGFALAAALGAALVLAGVPRWWRLLLFLPLAAGAYGVLQARAAT
jgi:fatty acid desaturase